jgi:hypothetical protein
MHSETVRQSHPVCAAAVASHRFLDGAATPPISGGELPASTFLNFHPGKINLFTGFMAARLPINFAKGIRQVC